MSVVLNTLTKFAKLAVGKHVVTAKQRHPKDPVFPLTVALSGLPPLTKVWANYEPNPKNTFQFRVNDADIYSLVKEEVDFDPTKTEELSGGVNVNGKNAISGKTPWIIDEVEERIQEALGMDHLHCLAINHLRCKSWVANELLDVLPCYDLEEHGLDKLILYRPHRLCEPFEEEVMSRLANMCPHLSHLQFSRMMYGGPNKQSMVNLSRQIIQNNPPI